MKAEDLVGTWRLRSWKNVASDGSAVDPLGEKPVGYIFYNHDGYMSVEIMAAHRVPYHEPDAFDGTPEERSEAISTYLSYSGPFEVLPDQDTVIHHIEVCSYPNWIGNAQVRFAKGLLGMRKSLTVLAAVTTCALALGAPVQAANTPNAGNGATVTRATLASGFVDESNVFYPATCDETQVINKHQRKETFHCTFDAAVPAPIVCDTSIGCIWFSDFDGAEATNTHFVITPPGKMVGWAIY